jgi:hypothetical protein
LELEIDATEGPVVRRLLVAMPEASDFNRS